jgi:hypothetical protein
MLLLPVNLAVRASGCWVGLSRFAALELAVRLAVRACGP